MSDLAAADDEALSIIRRICRQFPDVEEAAIQDRPLFRAGRRRFAIFNGLASPPRPRWAESGRSLHFLADPDELDALLQDERFSRSPHHGDRGWLALRLDASDVEWEEIAELLHAAHAQVIRGRS